MKYEINGMIYRITGDSPTFLLTCIETGLQRTVIVVPRPDFRRGHFRQQGKISKFSEGGTPDFPVKTKIMAYDSFPKRSEVLNAG